MIEAMGADIKAYTYDGDTPASARTAIRQAGHVVVTNPDMLHQGILPHHAKWVKLFENLRYVVIDEIHAYRGVFGSNLANVIRRLKRICAFYGSSPTFICCSATIRNPKELAEAMTGREMLLIDENGAPAGERHVVFYNPPVVNAQLGIRAGSIPETRNIAAGVAQVGHSEHRVRPRAADGRGAGAVSEGHGARSARQRRPRARLPRRLSAQPAARDRARAARREHHHGRLDERAGAGHRHRPA